MINRPTKIHQLFASIFLSFIASSALAAAGDLNSLLKDIQANKISENKENKEREARFQADKNQQKALLDEAKNELNKEQIRNQNLSEEFDINEAKLIEMSELLKQRSGNLGELFGVVRQFANDNQGLFNASMISSQYPSRSKFLANLSTRKELPTTTELERLWLEIHREMTESSRVVKYKATVISPQGNENDIEITRIGSFNAVANGKYLNYLTDTKKFETLAKQPEAQYLNSVQNLEDNEKGHSPFYIDPSRGVLLSLLVQSPTVEERIDQGGTIGYIILGLGVIGVLIALFCGLRLTYLSSKIKKQQKSSDIVKGNPLGEIMETYQNNKETDVETLELLMDEIIVKNLPKIERGIPLVKLIASVAPLLGLLGTVVGMIGVFQAITLFGTGDPKLMAGGISEALVTTMLGLTVAIPTLFFHNLLNGRAKSIIQTLEEQSSGFIARHKESSIAQA